MMREITNEDKPANQKLGELKLISGLDMIPPDANIPLCFRCLCEATTWRTQKNHLINGVHHTHFLPDAHLSGIISMYLCDNQIFGFMRHFMVLSAIVMVLGGCQSGKNKQETEASETPLDNIDIQGHRGARGILPENSIRGFLKAVDLGVNTLEMDLVITKDSVVIVSHEPFMSSEICLDQNRNMIPQEEAQSKNIYEMTYEEVAQYDCGSLMHPRFPSQGKVKVVKPKLSQVFQRVEQHQQKHNLTPLNYNIEIKSVAEQDNIFHPEPALFSDLVFNEIDGVIEWERVTIQSFDFRVLRYFREKYPDVRLAQLTDNEASWQQNVEELGFKPDIYSCYYERVSPEMVSQLHHENILVIPWTVNEIEDMRKMVGWGVDGIITDYPDRFQEF